MSSFQSVIADEVDRILPEIVSLRHTFHRHPELSGEEFNTSAIIRKMLKDKIELLPPFLETDVTGILNGAAPGKNITLRADMDALPLLEQSGVEYQSDTPGKMHACGHDGHTAMLAGAAITLHRLKSLFPGTVRFVFQPGEEVAALGRKLVEAGALNEPKPEMVLALHAAPGVAVGRIASRPGAIMAAGGFFKITITGTGGHGSKPESVIDAVLTSCRVVEAILAIPARNISAQEVAVISIGHIQGGTNANIIPEKIFIEGTFRFLKPEIGEMLPPLIERAVRGCCEITGASYEFQHQVPYIPTINNPDAVNFCRKIAENYLGQDCWQDLEYSSMGAEDFSYYLQRCRGAFCQLGIGENSPGLHNPNFDFNDQALRSGIIFLTATALEFLNHGDVV
jgi:amidohydrolase